MKHWTLKAAFAHFGTKARNHVWGWSAVSDDHKTVVVTVWKDQLGDDGSYDTFNHPNLTEWTNSLGNKDRIRNLVIARDNCNGILRTILVHAKDKGAIPRSIERLHPDESRTLKLVALDEVTGEFRAIPA